MRARDLLHLLSVFRSFSGNARNTFDHFTRKSTPSSILNSLNDSALAFFDRTIPTGDKYPYEVHYAPALRNAPTGVEAFHLVGRAWRKTPDAPVAIAFGFNAWKYGFMADYCSDVRIAFAPRKFLGWNAWRAARTMRPAPSRIYVWGYTDPRWLARFARKRGIPLIRVEDGFLRSAELGASHATPYSLVFDSKGLYYNASEPNDLADILANYDFAGDADLMENARSALDLLIEKRLSKYNMPDVGDPARHFSVKTRRRVLVLGQVDNDAAVRMGNPAGWRMSDIVRLAKLENPDAEILYRPHPEIYKGYQRSRLKAQQIEKFVRVVSPEGALTDLLESIDHVYTLTSLSGFEALLRGLEVTTLGTPFYAGWGLTDDRTQKARERRLTALELFAGVYLKYPRYLADVTESYLGFQAAAFRIVGDRALLTINRNRPSKDATSSILDLSPLAALAHLRGNTNLSTTANLAHLFGAPDLSPMAALAQIASVPRGTLSVSKQKLTKILERVFVENKGDQFHRIAATIISSKIRESELVSTFEKLIPLMNTRPANLLLLDLHNHCPEVNTSSLFSKLAERTPDQSLALELYDLVSKGGQEYPFDQNASETSERTTRIAADAAALRQRADLLLARADFPSAIDQACAATIIDGQCNSLIETSAEAAWQMFDFHSAYSLAHLEMHISGPQTAWALKLYWKTCPYVSFDQLFDDAALCACIRPNMIPVAVTRLREMEGANTFGMADTTLLKSHLLAFKLNIPYVQTLLEIGQFEDALDIILAVAADSQSYQSAVATSRCLTYLDRYSEAEALIDRTLATHKNKLVYDEALKICLYTGNYLKADRLLSEALARNIDLGQTLPCKIALGTHRYADGFRTYRDVEVSKDFARAFPQKHISNRNYKYSGKSITLLPIYGPGDEIRFASTYKSINTILDFEDISIGVEPRLLTLFTRSFSITGIRFFSTQRILRNECVSLERYDKLPFASLMATMDNNATEFCDKSTSVALVTDVLADILKEASDFSGASYLIPDRSRAQKFRARLPSGRPLIGLNWRSSVTLQSRQEHYLSVSDLIPLFESTDAQFVNLQYDDCEEELALIEERFPGRLVNLEDLDQYNDLDGVASLISCLDLVIAPCTTVAELSGALGQETLLLANSSEIKWRVKKCDNKDIWHNSVEHVFGKHYRDKSSLVVALIERLNSWLAKN